MLGASVVLGLRAAWLPCRLAPHLGVVLSNGSPDRLELDAGRALERAWLAATALDLAFQPMAAPTALERQCPGGGWVSPRVRERLEAGLERIAAGRGARPCMLFRLGRAAPPSVATQRLPLEGYVDGG